MSRNGRQHQPTTREVAGLFDKTPPHSLEAEICVLGAMILDPKIIPEILEVLQTGSDFYRESHGVLFDAMLKIYDRNSTLDTVQLDEALKSMGVLDEVGGMDRIVEIAGSVPYSASGPIYAKIVREKARLRKVIDAAGQMLYDAYHAGDFGDDGSREILDRAESMIFEIADQEASGSTSDLSQLLQDTMDTLMKNEGRAITGVPTGFYDIDEMTSGLQPGELIILAARPSMGKTSLALNLAEQIAIGPLAAAEKSRTPVAIFSMEMSRSAITQRLMCAHAQVDSHKFRTNRLGHDEFRRLHDTCAVLGDLPIYIDDTPGLTVMMLRAIARRMVKQYRIGAIVIDYLQLMSAPGSARDGRQQEVSAISRGIKALARELEIPIVCLAQLNRGAEQRTHNRPRMADLRESGSIEQDADVIMLLHREAYYHQGDHAWLDENPHKVGEAELIIAKQRNGPVGVVDLTWDAATTRFKNYQAPTSAVARTAQAQPAKPKRQVQTTIYDERGPDPELDGDISHLPV